MKRLLNKLNEIYKGEQNEKQYLIVQNKSGDFFYYWISDDVSDDATNSSFEKFREAVNFYKENGGVNSYIVHNHPKAFPTPSLMDYKNASLLNGWSSIFGLEVCDYMIFSSYGYYSFDEANEWEIPFEREAKDTYTYDLKTNIFNFDSLLKKKEEINSIAAKYGEIALIGSKLYFSSCLPLELIEKEVENECIKIIFFLKQKPEGEKTIQLVKRFLQPMTIIEILPDGHWETIL